jgi:integrase
MSDYLEKRRQLYYAVLTVPKALQDELGLLRFVKSTGEGDRRKAKDIASGYVLGWKLQIEEARGNSTTSLSRAMQWRAELAQAKDDRQRDIIRSLISDEAHDMYVKAGGSELPQAKAIEYSQISTGVKSLSEDYFEQWKAQLTVTHRTIDQYSKDLRQFIVQFPSIEDVTKKDVSLWMDGLSAKGVTKNTQRRILKACRNYWKYIDRYSIKGMVEAPFHKVILADKGKKKPPREAFEPHEIVELWTMARDNKAYTLADLIALGAYTGARIEELCSLMVKDVGDDVFNIIDSKTSAGVRAVPIHSHILPVIKRLKDTAANGYLLPDVTAGKYKERSGTMSSRFGKLKRKAGYGQSKVFHSLRHTFITALANANVLEYHIADIVGHEKKGVTGKVYSKATHIDAKRVDIEKVGYPFPKLI